MRLTNSQRAAVIGIFVQFLALIRLLAEYFRLKYAHGPSLLLSDIDPFIRGALITAALAALSTGLYVAAKYKAAIVTAATNVALLFAYKVVLLLR